MWTLVQALGLNKYLIYASLAAALVAAVGVAVLRIRASGAQAEKLRQVQIGLTRYNREVKERARIEAMRTDAARKQLRDKWSRRD